MGRNQHVVKSVFRVSIPQYVLAVASTYREENEGTATRSFRPVDTGIMYFRYKDGVVHDMIERVSGCSSRDIYDAIVAATNGRRTVWVITLGLRQLLDGHCAWDWWDAGDLSFGGSERPDGLTGRNGKPKSWSGCYILQDPPSIVEARVMDTGGRVKMIDVRNYGPKTYTDPSSTSAMLTQLWAWWDWYYVQLLDHDMGSWSPTASSQGWHTYRRKTMHHKLFVHANEAALQSERAAYYGGRCECKVYGTVGQFMHTENRPGVYHGQTSSVYQLDITGSYLGCARNLMVPTGIAGRCDGISTEDILRSSERYGVVAKVDIHTDLPLYPLRWQANRDDGNKLIDRKALPADGVRRDTPPKEGDVIWPIGKFTTWLCGPELEYACRAGHVARVGTAWIHHTEKALHGWINYIWPMYQAAKASGNAWRRQTLKAISLGLLGRFGAWSHDWVILPEHDARYRWDWWQYWDSDIKRLVPRRTVAGITDEYRGRSESAASMPAIGAWITAAGRMRLLELIVIAQWHNVYYYDTDSVWCNQEGYDRLVRFCEVRDDVLGYLRLVEVFPWVTWRGIKHYELPGRTVRAGMRIAPAGMTPGRGDGKESVPLPSELTRHAPPRNVELTERVLAFSAYRHGEVMPDHTIVPWRLKGVE